MTVSAPSLEGIVARWAGQRLGFDARALRLERILAAAQAQAQRLGSLQALESALESGSDRQAEEALVNAATVGETYFFRQHEHFDLLAELRLPADGRLLAWSAGCSSGEEAYSLAAALRQRFGLEADRLTVWGTDINLKALESARKAQYGRWSWRQDEDSAAEARRALALHPDTRACVRFAQHNLLEQPVFDRLPGQALAAERFDLVFCRNVLVYFAPASAEQAVARLHGALKPGGWLVLGNMDLGGAPAGFKRIGPPALCVYEKLPQAAPEPAAVTIPTDPGPAAPASPERPVAEDLDPVEWHAAILAEIEAGHGARALQELAVLVEAEPAYLPGLFEHALALRRAGKISAAAASLQRLLALAKGRRLDETVAGPEPLSLEYYVSSAQSFLDSAGGKA